MTDASGGALVPSVVKAENRGGSMEGSAPALGPMAVSASDTTDAPAATATATAAVIPESEAMVGGGGGAEATAAGGGGAAAPVHDRDLLCPICMGMIKDAFLTLCGHSFCYMCIVTHLNNKNDCPCCGHYLTSNQLYPNFLLNKTGLRDVSQEAR